MDENQDDRAAQKFETAERSPKNLDAYATLYLVRHGQTEWNLQDVLQGHLDSALTEKGVAQARELAERFAEVELAAVFASDVLRARRTAEAVALKRGLSVQSSTLLRERNWGRYDGRPASIFREECSGSIERYQGLPRERQWKFKYFDDIESFAEINRRFLIFLRETAGNYRGQNILAVSHQDVLGSTLINLGRPARKIGNMAWLKLLSDGANLFLAETDAVEF